jgi:hypothetical protein
MDKAYIRALIIRVVGARLPGETIDEYLARGSKYIGIGYRSFRAAYYGQDIGPGIYISKNTREKLEKAAKHARKPEYLIAVTEHQLRMWEADPELHRPYIDAAREFLFKLRGPAVPARNGDGATAAERAERAAAASAVTA